MIRILLLFLLIVSSFGLFAQKKYKPYKHYKHLHKLPHKPSKGYSFKEHKKDVKPENKIASPKISGKDEKNDGNYDETPSVSDYHSYADPTAYVSSDSLKKLKAILVVGYVEESTASYIAQQKQVANFLRSKGVKVLEFYSPKDVWNTITDSAKGAHIFLYSGHGNIADDIYPSGFWLTDGNVSSYTVSQELKLHSHALILFNHVCYGAGSSAGDTEDIGIAEACRRVGIYAHPFVDIKADCYYANNWNESIARFLDALLQKKRAKAIMEAEGNYISKIENTQPYKFNKDYSLSVSMHKSTGKSIQTTYINGVKSVKELDPFPQYDVAMVSKPGFWIYDFFKK